MVLPVSCNNFLITDRAFELNLFPKFKLSIDVNLKVTLSVLKSWRYFNFEEGFRLLLFTMTDIYPGRTAIKTRRR